ncbi:hypothetical protein BaRGS_00001026 [Batillaria attramentaria]|uniref:Uncharacterized protein n=1 Tax=Batillaria attramentaria TaxID=370345 RepID=A0ABD0M9E7_9CAEN
MASIFLSNDTYSLTDGLGSTLPPLCLAQIMTQAQWMQISAVPRVQATCCTLEQKANTIPTDDAPVRQADKLCNTKNQKFTAAHLQFTAK